MTIQRRDFLRASLATGAMLGLAQAEAFGREQEKKGGRAAVPKRLLILGGTGFLGPQIVEEATRRGHTLTLFNRGKTRPGLFPDIEKLHGDRNEPGAIKPLEGKKWDAVIDTSANVPRWVTDSAGLLAPNVKRYIYISSISVYDDTSKPGADETAPVGTIEDVKTETIDGRTYGPLKALSEKAAEAAMPGRVAVVRPGLIVGPEDPSDRFTYWPVRVARGGEVLAPGKPDDPVQLIDVRDLGAWLVRLVEEETTGVFDALGPDKPLSMAAMLDACKAASGGDARFTWADAAFLAEQKVKPWSDMPVWVPGEGETAGFARRNNARAIKAGLTFRPITDTAKATLDWFKTLPDDRRSKLRAGLTAEREEKVLAAWKARPSAKAGG
jgi:2'-hydroxyisoflavone reductase